MRYSVTFLERDYEFLTSYLFSDRTVERAAYLLCGISSSRSETKLLVREVVIVRPEEVESASERNIVINQVSYRRILKRADQSSMCFVFVHSHPEGYPNHSSQDDREEADLFRSAYARIHHSQAVHASIVISNPQKPIGRVWLPDGTNSQISRIRVMGRRFVFFDPNDDALLETTLFDRQIRAFGEHIQKLLSRLHVGIVGLGGTGSAVCEQLTRLGIGQLTISDPQSFEATNVNRVYGSRRTDDEVAKAEIAKRLIKEIGIGTTVHSMGRGINDREVAEQFKNCDLIFGCTDDEWGRSILTKLSIMYFIPVFDLGVEVDTEGDNIKSVRGRVTTLMPGSPCLFCRGVVSPDVIAAEILHSINPDEYEKRKREGYVPGLPGTAPAVITFTSSIAAAAISEMLHRLTGYMGSERNSTELILRFDESKVSTNSKVAKPTCWCSLPDTWGQGDVDPFLNMTWVAPA